MFVSVFTSQVGADGGKSAGDWRCVCERRKGAVQVVRADGGGGDGGGGVRKGPVYRVRRWEGWVFRFQAKKR